MVQTAAAPGRSTTTSSPVIVFSADTHIGPRIEDLRPYCEAEYLEAYDAWAAEARQGGVSTVPDGPFDKEFPGGKRRVDLNRKTTGHHDMHQRLLDMNDDGVAASAIFHGSQNGEPFPFRTFGHANAATFVAFKAVAQDEQAMVSVGIRIYNRWLADVCSIEPERHVGLAHLPTWDVDATVREIEWAREAGLRGLNWPAPRAGTTEFDDPAWDPCWAAAAALGMSLNTHVGTPVPGIKGARDETVQGHTVVLYESGGWPSRRGIARMIFGGVFERHPDLKLVMTEQPGVWWPYLRDELDSIWMHKAGKSLKEVVPKKPSEYFHSNVYVGGTFMSRDEASTAIDEGFTDNLFWGSDYPHHEGAWAYPDGEYRFNRTNLALRDTFAGLPADHVHQMVGGNAVQIYDLNADALTRVAQRIGGPSLDELARPLEAPELAEVERILNPAVDYTHAFRRAGPWY